jgi:hypothetical protein
MRWHCRRKGGIVDNWFPLSKSMMEGNADFRKLTPAEKVFWLSILSRVNLRGQFYKADLEWAVMLALSLSKARQARRKFQALGWLTVLPGRFAGRRRLATHYYSAKWAKCEDGVYFTPMHRYTWEQLVRLLREKQFCHRDLVVYAFLCYSWQRFGGQHNDGIFVTKSQLRYTTNLSSVEGSLRRLHGNFRFHGGAHLFEFRDEYHRFRITSWAQFADPCQDKRNARVHAETEHALNRAITREKARQLEKAAKKRILELEHLTPSQREISISLFAPEFAPKPHSESDTC